MLYICVICKMWHWTRNSGFFKLFLTGSSRWADPMRVFAHGSGEPGSSKHVTSAKPALSGYELNK